MIGNGPIEFAGDSRRFRRLVAYAFCTSIAGCLFTAMTARPCPADERDMRRSAPPTAPALSDPSAEWMRFKSTETHMGTSVTIVLVAPNQAAADRGFQAAFARVAEVDRSMSDYDSESEVSRLSARSPMSEATAVSDDLWRVLTAARDVSDRSGGAFDVTVGPLTKLWRRARRRREMPPADLLKSAREAVDYRAIEFDNDRQSVKLTRPDMRIDLGGIAKGYAVDAALAALARNGIRAALVDAGGDIAASGPPPGEPGWTIGVRAVQRDGPPTHFLQLADRAVATSGDAWQFVEIEGTRYSHIVDPKTGLGLTQRSGVSIVAPNCMMADAYASAVSVLGPREGMRLIESTCSIEGMIVTVENDLPHERISPGWNRSLVPPPADRGDKP